MHVGLISSEVALLVVVAVFCLLLLAIAGIIVTVFFSRRGDCNYARAVFREYTEFRSVAGPDLTQDEIRALDHALIESRDPALVLQILSLMPKIGDRPSLHFIDQCARGTGGSAPAANDEEVRRAAGECYQKLVERLEEDGKCGTLLRAASGSEEDELLRPAVSGCRADPDSLLRPDEGES